MSVKRTVSFIIALVLLGLIVSTLLQAEKHPKIRNLRAGFVDKIGIISANLTDSITPSRRPPITTIELEENLKVSLPVPFGKFSQDDWSWFWRLLYGRFTVDSGGWPRRKRQLSREEIENVLADYYQPFGHFDQNQWGVFWQQVLKGRVF